MFAPGDGSVSLSSLLSSQYLGEEVPRHEQERPATGRNRIVCARHDTLTSNDELLAALIEYLLAPEPAAEAEAP